MLDRYDLLSWTVLGGCLIGSILYPSEATKIWVTGISFVSLVVLHQLLKPVNYEYLKFDSDGFRHKANGAGPLVGAKWSEITDVFYHRFENPFTNDIDTEWEFHRETGNPLIVLVEWPQKKRFSSAVIENLPTVCAEKVRQALNSQEEGRWNVWKDK